jgi:ATP synthase proteolipid subunit
MRLHLDPESYIDYISDVIPVVMAGIIAIYGLVVSVLISNSLGQSVSLFASFIQLGMFFALWFDLC